jgi:hypothetical protein
MHFVFGGVADGNGAQWAFQISFASLRLDFDFDDRPQATALGTRENRNLHWGCVLLVSLSGGSWRVGVLYYIGVGTLEVSGSRSRQHANVNRQ